MQESNAAFGSIGPSYNPDAMNTLSFLASIADTVGVPATNWDAPGIIFLKLLAVAFFVLLNGLFVASEFAIVKVRASQLDALAAPSNGRRPISPARHQPLRRLSVGNAAGHHLGQPGSWLAWRAVRWPT